MPNYKKRNTYQTGGAAKPQMPRSQALAREAAAARAMSDRMRRERGLMELGNRQRAAANRARTQRPAQGPSRAQAARNMAEYERAMAARQANFSRGSTPARPRVPTPRPAPQTRPPSTSINVGGGRALPAIRPPNYRPPVRPNTRPATPPRPNANATIMTREGITFNQQIQAERSRIQQQIAQLQARLRQLGG